MNIPHFKQYANDLQVIEKAFGHLPDFDVNAVFATWEAGNLFLPEWKNSKLFGWWMNVAAHMSVAAVLGYKLSLFMKDSLAKEGFTPKDIIEALLVHDWAKRLESDVLADGAEMVMRESEMHHKTLLQWFPEKVTELTAATGDNGVQITDTRQFTSGEKIIFYSDYCTSSCRIVPFVKRLEELLPHFARGGRYEKADAYYKKHYRMSHNEKITQLLAPIEAEFIALTGGAKKNFPACLIPDEFCENTYE
ncbi:MAG: hypothetical protein G01um101417_292 [Parcubacteria group bacterium Gr01-1014_17]|nr:MAG: hypothetical protein G01um101417_292 [Parcubacteria group bacterium Gr01-1014_17]